MTQQFVRPLYHWRTSRPHEYSHSLLNSRDDDNLLFKSGPAHGAPPKNIKLGPNNYLLDHLGGGFDLLYFTDEQSLPEQIIEVVNKYKKIGVPVKVIAVGANESVLGADIALPDSEGHFRSCYGVNADGAGYLFRPDQHICARWLTLDANRLDAAFKTALPQ